MAIGLEVVNGDIVIDYSGSVNMLNSSRKCARDLGKLLITDSQFEKPQSVNSPMYLRYNPTYGTELNNKLLYAGLSRIAIKDTVVMKLNEALKRYIQLQELRGNLNLEEIITSIDFDVVFDSVDPSKMLITIRYKTLAGDDEILGQYEQRTV